MLTPLRPSWRRPGQNRGAGPHGPQGRPAESGHWSAGALHPRASTGHDVPMTAMSGTGAASMTFEVADPGGLLAGVRLRPDLDVRGDLDFRRVDGRWELTAARPPARRMEYLLELRFPDGSSQVGLDPANPRRVPGAFGPKSVREFPGYAAPAWLAAPAPDGASEDFEVPARALGQVVPVRTWSPAGVPDDKPLPLLVVHDGPEYDRLASLTRYLAAGTAAGWLPPLRAALLGPGRRDRWYSANQSYARALVLTVLPAVADRLATSVRVGMGTSLGGLAMLHAHCRHPGTFDALFLQSGSFFLPRFDSHEQWFPHYQRITAFVAAVTDGDLPGRPVPAALTCGTAEENLANNRAMTAALHARGYPAELHEVPDAHNYTAWRDAFHPYLTGLLARISS